MAIIQKAHLPLQLRIQMIHNRAVDEKVLRFHDDYDDEFIDKPTVPAYSEEVLIAEIGRENLLATSKDFERLLQRSIVTQDNITRMEQMNASRKISDKITKVEVERVNKNLQTVEKILNEADFDLKVYKELIQKMPTQVSRQDILEKAVRDGQNFRGREYSYKELKNLSRDLEQYKDNALRYEEGMMANRQADREGVPKPNTEKVWLWSQCEKTRHEGMVDSDPVRFTEKFEVVNDITGDVDYLRFPKDIENDSNNCSNICNCKCEWSSIIFL